MTVDFLTLEEVLALHQFQLEQFGGADGIRDQALLESAIAQPQTSFGGEFLHADLFEMAAAYLFHIVNNHAFVDGNKRTGLLAALVFLDLNGIVINRGTSELFDVTITTAEGTLEKSAIALQLRALAPQA